MTFEKSEVSSLNYDEILVSAFPQKPTVNLLKKFKFTEIDQYEIVVQDDEK